MVKKVKIQDFQSFTFKKKTILNPPLFIGSTHLICSCQNKSIYQKKRKSPIWKFKIFTGFKPGQERSQRQFKVTITCREQDRFKIYFQKFSLKFTLDILSIIEREEKCIFRQIYRWYDRQIDRQKKCEKVLKQKQFYPK